MSRQNVPIFFACDDAFVKFTAVSIRSLIDNASADNDYTVYILHAGIDEALQERTRELSADNVKIVFADVQDRLREVSERLPLRDYYSKTTYFRLFIAEMFPEYDKAIYIDSDTVVQGDVAELFSVDLGESIVGACHEQAMVQTDNYGEYVEQVVGVSRYNYFNAGVLLINCKVFRERSVLAKFLERLRDYNFVVTQDEDYLNLICKDHVFWLDQKWNTEVYGEIPYPIEEAKIIHYIMVNKPWHYADCMYGDLFWKYAERTAFYDEIVNVLESYTDEERRRDEQVMDNLMALAKAESERDDNYQKMLNSTIRARDRVEILEKIAQYEREGRFDEDVEDDPPSRTLMPDEIEYGDRSVKQKVKTRLAFSVARRFVNSLIEDKKLIIKDIKGIENLKNLKSGAIVTCNHFNAFDSFAMQLTYERADIPERELYRVIREGNYTSFPGFYGFLMRNCNTLPLSSNIVTMKKFMKGVDDLLSDGHLILVYPEQSMWWNYRKPKPLQRGAYIFAYRNDVPVVPCFITMKDSDLMGDDGFYVQEYTIHVSEPIYPDKSLPYRAAITELMDKNYALWKEIYEREYNMPLVYDTENGESETSADEK
ncbi:MAG: 1-acyl-sn-glycerol-3-phosphate acyltransferase [Clostridia bacterium]|nr:1-acyl-sn-glycerol-3-phosphate acyltransferase [Clostridia bacterium]